MPRHSWVDRVPPAGDQQQVGLDRLGRATGTGDVHRRHPRVALGPRHRPTVADVDAERAHRIAGRTALAHVDHGGDLDPGVRQDGRGVVPGVVRGEDHGALAGRHAEAVRVRHRGRSQHHAGTVAVGERDRAFVRAGGQHDPPGPDVPQGGHRGGTFEHHHVPVVVDAERGGLASGPRCPGRCGVRPRRRRSTRAPGSRRSCRRCSPCRRASGARRPASFGRLAGRRRAPHAARRLRRRPRGCPRGRAGDRAVAMPSSPSASTPTPGRPVASRWSSTLTIGAGMMGSNDGAVTSTNAQGSSTPAENTPRGRPRIGDGHTTSTPLASSALARVSPANASSVPPFERHLHGRRPIDAVTALVEPARPHQSGTPGGDSPIR